jgi:hypothetical protein
VDVELNPELYHYCPELYHYCKGFEVKENSQPKLYSHAMEVTMKDGVQLVISDERIP